MLYIGVDLGTSSVKLLLMDEAGSIKSIVTREYPLYFPKPGWSEQDPEDWYAALVDGMKELTKDCDTALIDGISFSGQMHGMVILDENDHVIRPAILWNDGRTQAECDYLNKDIGREKISAYTANMALTGFTAPKLLWVRKHEPENFARIKKVMLPKDYIAYKLSGIHCTDVSDASGMLLFDVKNKCWSKEMLEICGLKEEQMAKIHESYQVVGSMTEKAAKELGLTTKVKVIAGGGDQAVAAVGTGTVGVVNAMSPWVPPVLYSFPRRSLQLTRIIPFMPSLMRMVNIISWVLCCRQQPPANGGLKRFLQQRIIRKKKNRVQNSERIMCFSYLI
jgi:xylulokinase